MVTADDRRNEMNTESMQRNPLSCLSVLAAAAVLAAAIIPNARAGELHAFGHPDDLVSPEAAGEAADLYGSDVALDGDTLLVSRPEDRNAAGTLVGSVRVYQRQGDDWLRTATLEPSGNAANSRFGSALDLDGDVAVIGALSGNDAYIFRRTAGAGWQQEAAFSSPSNNAYGNSVAVQAQRVVVGARNDGLFAGTVFSYAYSGGSWVLEQQLAAPQAEDFAEFGYAVALAGDFLFVGSRSAGTDESGNPGPGAVDVYARGNAQWVHQVRLSPADGQPWDGFGAALDSDGQLLVVGAPDQPDAQGTGAAYVYRLQNGSWTFSEKLQGTPGAGYFGSAVAVTGAHVSVARLGGGVQLYARTGNTLSPAADYSLPPVQPARHSLLFAAATAISGNVMAAGAYHRSSPMGAVVPGLVKLYQHDGSGWREIRELREPESAQNERYGHAMAVSGDTALVALPYGNLRTHRARSGWVQVLVRSGVDWIEQARLAPGGANELYGSGAWLALDGDTALVRSTATGPGLAMGPVHVFSRTGTEWVQQADLDLAALANRSAAVGVIQQDTIVLGMPEVEAPGNLNSAGAVLVFERSNGQWQRTARLDPSAPVSSGQFGQHVALDGQTLLVRAAGGDAQSGGLATAYVYTRSGGQQWTLQQRLLGTAVAPLNGAVALTGDSAFFGTGASSVLQYQRSGISWTPVATLTPTPISPESRVGNALAVNAGRLLVGAPLGVAAGSADPAASAVYLYTLTNGQWSQQTRLNAPRSHGAQNFGSVLAQSGTVSLIGVPTADSAVTGSQDVGAAYLLRGDAPFAQVPLFDDGFEDTP